MSTLAERFEAKVDRSPGQGPNGDCHQWTASLRNGNGYGQINMGNGTRGMKLAHRVAWLLGTGAWPTPCCLHTCDNRSCVRLDHLFEGTVADNNADMRAKGRASGGAAGERNHQSKLTVARVHEVRSLAGQGWNQKDIAAAYGISQSLVSQVRCRQAWAAF